MSSVDRFEWDAILVTLGIDFGSNTSGEDVCIMQIQRQVIANHRVV